MKRLNVHSIILLVLFFTYTVLAQDFGSVRSEYELKIPPKIHKLVLDPLPAGTYSVGSGGHFPTIDSAFNKLSIDGIAGEVILELTDALYTTPSGSSFILNGPITGAGPSNRITIKPADNVAVTINGDGEAVLLFYDVSYLTIDGINPQGSTSLKVHAFYNDVGTQWNDAIDFYGDCDLVQVKNLTVSSDDFSRFSAGIFLGNINNQSAPDSGLITGVFVPVANSGIYLLGDGTFNPTGNVISNNHIGSPSDSLIAWGIQNETADGTIIENNIIENMRKGNLSSGIYFVYGIQSYVSDNVIIRNNVIHNIAATKGPTRVQGIFISAGSQRGNNNWIYNNMVFDIRTYVSNVHWLAGIFVDHNYPKIEYNTVWLSEANDVAPAIGSSALYILSATVSPSVRNNILINTRNDEPYTAVAARYFVSNISDFNDLYAGPFQHSYVGYFGGTYYKTLADWQATGKDLNSITEMPNFKGPYLHVDASYSTLIDGGAIPIPEISTDFDGDTRDGSTPDIGADEFTIIPVELTSFTATTQSGKVILNWLTATELNNHGFEVQRRNTKNNFATIAFLNGNGTTTEQHNYTFTDKNISSGIYYYRLKQVDFNGRYEYSKSVEVIIAPNEFSLEQNYPNPFNPATVIKYSIPEASKVILKLYNLLSEEISTLVNEEKVAGYYKVEFNATTLPSGVYFYRLNAGNYTAVKKMILLK